MGKGKLITFEGVDGCGKSTQMHLLESYLTDRGIEFISTREPGGTELGKKIRSALLDGASGSVEPLAELLLYSADRAQHVRTVISPALDSGKVVLSDRFYDATTVYQGYARGFDLKLIDQLNELAVGGVKPDLTLLFDLDVEVALGRMLERTENAKSPNRLDREPAVFHQSVRRGYLELAAREPERFRVIPAQGSIRQIFEMMLTQVERILEEARLCPSQN